MQNCTEIPLIFSCINGLIVRNGMHVADLFFVLFYLQHKLSVKYVLRKYLMENLEKLIYKSKFLLFHILLYNIK